MMTYAALHAMALNHGRFPRRYLDQDLLDVDVDVDEQEDERWKSHRGLNRGDFDSVIGGRSMMVLLSTSYLMQSDCDCDCDSTFYTSIKQNNPCRSD